MDTENTPFKVNQEVVYPSQGVGVVQEIFYKPFRNKIVKYYKIYLEVSDMIVMVPVANASMLGIRAIVSADEAKRALEKLGEAAEPITSDWKLRYQMNLDLLKKGSIDDITSVVRCLYQRSKVKELPIQERKIYDSAKKLLEDEISFALGISAAEVEKILHEKLELLNVVHEKKPAPAEKDDDDDDFIDEETENESSDSDDDDMDDDDMNDGSDLDD